MSIQDFKCLIYNYNYASPSILCITYNLCDVIEAIEWDAAVAPESSKPAKSIWMPINAPPVPRSTVCSYQNSLISIGGVKDNSPQNMIYEFVNGKVDNSWIEVGNMRVGRYCHGVVTLGKHGAGLCVAGGFVQGKPTEDEVNEKSQLVEIVFLQDTYMCTFIIITINYFNNNNFKVRINSFHPVHGLSHVNYIITIKANNSTQLHT